MADDKKSKFLETMKKFAGKSASDEDEEDFESESESGDEESSSESESESDDGLDASNPLKKFAFAKKKEK